MDDQNKLSFNEPVQEIVIDFGQICRFCLIETSSNVYIQDKCIMNDSVETEPETIYNFVSKFTSIQMKGAENFPSLVCENCYEVIKVCYSFSQVCQQSDSSLRDCYEKTLKETKKKLVLKDENESEISTEKSISSGEISNKAEDINIEDMLIVNNVKSNKKNENQRKTTKGVKWKQMSRHKGKDSLSILKADNIKLKYQRINSLSERLKEAQLKLAEDILRSNDLMFGLPKGEIPQTVQNDSETSKSCPQCSLKFNSSDALKFHYAATHGHIRKFITVTKFQCKRCVKSFSEQEKLIKHYKNIHNVPESDLTEEDKNHKVKKSVRVGKRKFFCLHCVPYKVFHSREELVEHLAEYHEMSEVDSQNGSVVFACGRCDSTTTFPSRLSLNRHLRTVHKLQENEIKQRDVKCLKNGSVDDEELNANQKLFKVFVCTDCSPPVQFTSVDECVQHKIQTHDKQLENISTKELGAVFVDSMNVFQQGQKGNSEFSFKMLCKSCEPPIEFTTVSEFVNHLSSLHDKSTLDNWEIESKPTLEGKGHEPKKKSQMWNCSECSASYFRRQSLYYHMKEKHNKHLNLGAMKCLEPECSESFFTNRQLIQHGISVHQKYFANFHKIYKKNILQPSSEEDNRVKNFECDICQKKYVCKNSLKRHILKTHLGKVEVESVVCPYCGKTLSNKLNLKSHIEFVHEALFVSCPICKKKINFRTIGKHYKTHQTNSEFVDPKNLFLCNICGKTLKSKRGFEDHQKLHKNVRDQLCDICGSGFTTKKFLHLHKKIHEGVRRKVYECHLCDKVFSGRHTLNRHLLTHSGEKNFICEICSKCFYTLQELNRHVRCHKKEYRFDCQLCDMRFLDKSRFRHHMMRHRNIRPHKCQFCDKMFIVRGKMNLHMAAKHNVERQSIKAVWKDPKTYVPLDNLL